MASSMSSYICWMKLFLFVLPAEITGLAGLESVIMIHQEVGGTATFGCPSEGTDYNFLYLQKREREVIFVNGDHQKWPLTVDPIYWNRSYVDKEHRTVILQDLHPADEGHYQCLVKANHGTDPAVKNYQLRVTANYSRPQVNVTREESTGSCSVTCSSSGGYPWAAPEWVVTPVLDLDMSTQQNITQDPVNGLFSIFTGFVVNISRPLNVTCIVGNLSSETLLEACDKRVTPPRDDIIIIIACVIISVLFIFCLAVVLRRRRCHRSARLVVAYTSAQRK